MTPVKKIEVLIVSEFKNADQSILDIVYASEPAISNQISFSAELNSISIDDFNKYQEYQVANIPTILFIDLTPGNESQLLRALGPSEITTADIQQTFLGIEAITENTDGEYIAADGSILSLVPLYPSSAFGNLLCKYLGICGVPKIVWAAVGVLALYKTFDSSTKLGQIGFGAISAYSAYKYLK